MFKKKALLTLVLFITLALMLAACGPQRDEEVAPEENAAEPVAEGEEPAKPEQLTMWVNDEESQIDAYEAITAKYTEETGIEVELVPFSMLDQTEALSLDGPSGSGPDIFFQPHDRLGDVYLQGLAAELELTEEQLQGYPEGTLDAFSYEGGLYGVPAVIETYGLFYNTDLVPEAPETMEELMEIAANLTNAGQDEYGFLMEATNFYFTYPFLTAEGGYVFGTDADGALQSDDIGLATEETVKGAELIQSWFTEGYVPNGITGDVMNGLFQDGKVGAVVTGPWSIPDYQAALGDKLAVATLPTMNGEPLNSFSGVKGWLVSEYSDEKFWATDLALFVTNAESSLTYFETAGELPARSDVELDDELRNGILAQAEHAVAMPNIPEMSQVWDPMAEALEFISQGDDPEAVLNEAVDQIKEQIELSKAGQ
ncbi:extracellular solute-binding protein [Bacillus suaedae]|uniref:Maltodextrin-binding protein n=1 Tax=Halalkalibacter suaedae TaxID=2822140 RepID=A0A940WSV9_9BACI|nr:extracellular solute-binding protein [Bacillus suaedae]MBP3950027.1 extracellular solute-binding protein [Bacillus suaedae]